jgi:hypothetical protein
MAVELDIRHPLLLKTGWENEDLTLIWREKMDMFAYTNAFNARCKGKHMKRNKIMIVKNRKLAIQSFFFNMHTNFPFGNIKRLSLLWKICLTMILRNIGIVCFFRIRPIYIRYTLYSTNVQGRSIIVP